MMATEEKPAEKMDLEEGGTDLTDEKEPAENGSTAEAEEKADKPKSELEPTAGALAAANLHYRVKISGLPRFYTPTDPLLVAFKKLLSNELGLDFRYIRSPKKGNSWLYITFYNQTNQEKALKLLKNYKWKGRTLICTLVVADVLKRKQEDCGDELTKRPRLDIPIEEQMLMSTIPYHTISYDEQLSKKNEEATCLFKWLATCMEKKTPKLIGYIDKEIAKNFRTKLPFKLDQVRASPVIDGYRNKCEFRIGLDPQTKKVVVGYRVDNQEDDNIAVAPPDSLRHLPKEMLDVVKVFEKFVQDSPYPPQKVNHDTGVWRLLHVRINRAKQLMVVVLINPTVLEEGQLAQLKEDLIKYFKDGPASAFNIVSLYFHTDNDVKTLGGGDKVKRPQGQLELLWGQTHMEEKLLDLELEIDPNFYFQNNTWGAEELYKAVVELAGVDEETTVLDLCCGSGGMGMMFAKQCKEVIGVEVMDVNVDDAKRLAAKNGLTNCEFLQGAVDDLFPELEEKLKGKKVVPILDPPRVGISSKLILSLRKMKEAQRIIYVCSNHKLPSKNIMDMSLIEGENKEYVGTNPFFPTRVIPVDISPHSLRCELVILLERLDLDKLPPPMRSAPNKSVKGLYYSDYPKESRFKSRGRVLAAARAARGGVRGIRGGAWRRPVAGRYRPMPVRDTLYPPPLRGNLYQDPRRSFGSPGAYEQVPPRPYSRGVFDYPPDQYGPPPRREYDNGLSRYSEFRRDVEDAIDSSYPSRGQVSKRLAMANAMLEQGLRLASEAMADEYPRPPVSHAPPIPPPPPYVRRARAAFGGMRPSGMGGNSWDGNNDYPAESWRSSWDGDDYDIIPQGGGNRGYGGPPKLGRGKIIGRGLRGITRGSRVSSRGRAGKGSGGVWRR